jgi:hypothetical protein
MNLESHKYLKKTVFWQRFTLVVLSAFLLIMWGGSIFFFVNRIGDTAGMDWIIKRERAFLFMFFFGYLLVGTYLDYILFQAQQALHKYLESSDMVDLELGFRKQRHFWMALTLILLSVVAVFLFMIGLLRGLNH